MQRQGESNETAAKIYSQIHVERQDGFACCGDHRDSDAPVQVKKSVGKSDKKSGKKSDKKILDHLKDYPTATLEELQGLTGLSSGGIRKAIRRLKDAKLLRRVGPDKGGHWEVLNGGGE